MSVVVRKTLILETQNFGRDNSEFFSGDIKIMNYTFSSRIIVTKNYYISKYKQSFNASKIILL